MNMYDLQFSITIEKKRFELCPLLSFLKYFFVNLKNCSFSTKEFRKLLFSHISFKKNNNKKKIKQKNKKQGDLNDAR